MVQGMTASLCSYRDTRRFGRNASLQPATTRGFRCNVMGSYPSKSMDFFQCRLPPAVKRIIFCSIASAIRTHRSLPSCHQLKVCPIEKEPHSQLFIACSALSCNRKWCMGLGMRLDLGKIRLSMELLYLCSQASIIYCTIFIL